MRVILLQSVQKLGQTGEVKEVADGYARNFLIPKKLAAPATPDRLQSAQKIAAAREHQAAKIAKDLRRLRQSLDGYICKMIVRANPQGTLFAAVTPLQLSAILKAEGYDISPDMVEFPYPLKTVGEHTVKVDLGEQGRITIAVEVVAK